MSGSRRLLDLAVAGAALLVLALPLAVLMLLVRLDSPGPALYRQVRLGEHGRPFTLYKLRSMRTGATGPEVTATGDPRVTRLGGFLRRTSLDELPQLWHVLRGQMTLVGPRPETPGLAAEYPPECRWVFRYRPGLTGPAQVRLRDTKVDGADYFGVVVPARVAQDAGYLRDPSLRATLAVLAETARYLVRG
jgi:lipopolysaccharide/colanic/teichoic acid biosynthesis glycosyltransferase